MIMLAQLIAWLNAGMNKLFGLLRGSLGAVPSWLTLTLISGLLGVVLLILFKYTSNQTAIGRVRDKIKANLLTMKLFKDNIPVVLRSQFKVFGAAAMLLAYSLPPVFVMALPFCLILGQLGVWYQAAPLELNQEAVVVMQFEQGSEHLPEVLLAASGAFSVEAGPVHVPAKQQIFWKIKAVRSGTHRMKFDVDGEQVEKTLSIGSEKAFVSMKRPGMQISDLILYPAEVPLKPSSPVRSIAITYPDRDGLLTGSGNWVITLFVVSMLSALLVKPIFKVKI